MFKIKYEAGNYYYYYYYLITYFVLIRDYISSNKKRGGGVLIAVSKSLNGVKRRYDLEMTKECVD
jgi:hypothetical protein